MNLLTRCGLAVALVAPLASSGCVDGAEATGFEVVAQLDVGLNPHQISFSEDGRTAYVATAGEDRITVVDAVRREIAGTIPVQGSPLGVVPLPNRTDLAVARFELGGVVRYARSGSPLGGDRGTSAGASLFVGPFEGDRYLVSVEQADSVHVFDGGAFTFTESYAVADRPFPGSVTSDGRLAFVPGYDEGAVTVIDLFNDRIVATVPVGERPSGGSVLPGDIDYAVVVRGEDRVVFINTASRSVVGELTEGIGSSPFSLVVAPNGRLAFVNNTGSADVSVIDLATREVIERIPVPDVPIVMAVHPSGSELWVSSEGVHRVTVISIPDAWRDDPRNLPVPLESAGAVTEVAVMGMTHSGHTTSEVWGLEEVEQAVRAFAPDVLCTEIAPDRWERIERDLLECDAIEDPRVLRFPEYKDLLLRLSVELQIEVEPCAGWTLEMSDLRQTRIAQFGSEDRWAQERAEYAAAQMAWETARGGAPPVPDDPAYIHSDAYDADQKGRLALYDHFQNDMIGPGGWTNINVEHYRQVDRTLRAHAGKRVLITFGGGHKYWLLERLRERDDVRLLDMGPFLPN